MSNPKPVLTPIDSLSPHNDLVHGYTARDLGDLNFRTSPEAAAGRRHQLAEAADIDPSHMFTIPLGHTNRIAVLKDNSFLRTLNGRGAIPARSVETAAYTTVTRDLPTPETIDQYYDGAVWNLPDLYCLIITADCAGVAFYDPETGACGNSHVGLLGAVNKLPESMVKAMNLCFKARSENIEVVIYPCVRSCHYDVSRSRTWQIVKEDVFAAYGRDNPHFSDTTFDLPGFITAQLIKAGISASHIFDTGLCTTCRYDQFFSHVGAGNREAQQVEGRFGTIIGRR